MNIKEKLTCNYCNEIYKQPVTLACGDTICIEHIDKIISSDSAKKLISPICNQENVNQNHSANKLVEALLQIEIHKFELDPKYELIFNNLKREIQNLEKILNDPENYIYEEINELKRQVDLDRENLKSEIDNLADELIKKLESYDAMLKAEYKTKVDLDYYTGLVESSKKQLDDYEKCLKFFSSKNEERSEKCIQSEVTINKLQPNTKELKDKLLADLKITYHQAKIKKEDLFGKLIISVS